MDSNFDDSLISIKLNEKENKFWQAKQTFGP